MRRHLLTVLVLGLACSMGPETPPVLTLEQVHVFEKTLKEVQTGASAEMRSELRAYERVLETGSAPELLAATQRMRRRVGNHPVPALRLVLDQAELAARSPSGGR